MSALIVDSMALTRTISGALTGAIAQRALAERQLQGVLQVSSLLRLQEDLADRNGEVQWQAEFSCTEKGERRLWLQAQADMKLVCQRCLEAMDYHIEIDRLFQLVETEEEADRLFEADPEAEIETVAAGKKFDLSALIEDEIILALPTIRAHEECPEKLPASAGEEVVVKKKPSPFAGLAALAHVCDRLFDRRLLQHPGCLADLEAAPVRR